MKKEITIKEIEVIEGIAYDSTTDSQATLPQWYKDIRSKKLSQLSDGDLSRFIRQGIYLEYIDSECISRLHENPFAGEKYDGELIEALSKNINVSFWNDNDECKKSMNDFLIYFNAYNLFESYEEFDMNEMLESINHLRRNLI